MANLIYPDAGLGEILTRFVANGFLYKLFVNDVLPDRATQLIDLTEAAWSGYVPILVPGSSFALGAVSGNVDSIAAGMIFFPNTSPGPQSVYGYYVTDLAAAVLIAVQRFDGAPITFSFPDTLPVVPTFGTYSANAN